MASEQKIKAPTWNCELCGLTELYNEKENKIEKIDAKHRDTLDQEFVMTIPVEPGNERPKQKSTTKTATKKTTTKKTTTRTTKKATSKKEDNGFDRA